MSSALLKYNTAVYVSAPVSKEEKRSCMVVRSCVSHEKATLKPGFRCLDVVFFKVSHNVAVDDVFNDFTWNRCKEDWTIVFW